MVIISELLRGKINKMSLDFAFALDAKGKNKDRRYLMNFMFMVICYDMEFSIKRILVRSLNIDIKSGYSMQGLLT